VYTGVYSIAEGDFAMTIQEAAVPAVRVKVVQPGEGKVGGLAPGIGVVFKIDGADSGGALSIVEHPFIVGALVPPHVHHLEDEYSIVLEGEIGFRSEDREVVLGAGGYIVKPRGEVHAMWNAGSVPARMIEIISPAGFERFFVELSEMASSGPLDPAEMQALGQRYQLPFAQPAWLPDVIERYHLTPMPS
jgi:quercetin dioxygenase-like cupin family protein